MNQITKEEFEIAYANRSGVSLERLHSLGRESRHCHCGDPICEGWQMVNAKEFDDDEAERKIQMTTKETID